VHRSERSYDVHQELALTQQELAHQRAESRRKSARMDKVEALVAEAYKELEASLKREQSLREKLATNDRRWKEEVEALMQQLPIPNEQEILLFQGRDVPLPGTGFENVPLPGTGFEDVPLPGTGFENVPLPGTGFENVPLPGTGFENVPLPGTGFEDVPLPGTGPGGLWMGF